MILHGWTDAFSEVLRLTEPVFPGKAGFCEVLLLLVSKRLAESTEETSINIANSNIKYRQGECFEKQVTVSQNLGSFVYTDQG